MDEKELPAVTEYGVFNVEKPVLKLGKRSKPTVTVTRSNGEYKAPEQSMVSETVDANSAAQKKKDKAMRRKQLAYFMAKATGGDAKAFEKVIASEDWDDLDVQEMLLGDRFARFREVPLVSTNELVKAKVAQTNKNATTRKLEQIQEKREFIGKQTGEITSDFEETTNLITPETVVAGKIRAAGLENELAAVLTKYDQYQSMSPLERAKSFSNEELAIYKNLIKSGLTPSMLTGKKAVLDFGDKGGTFDVEKEDIEQLSEVSYAQDFTSPHQALASILGAFNKQEGSYDVIPLTKESSPTFYEEEFKLKAPVKVPEYMKVANTLQGLTPQQQQTEVLGLPDEANVQQYFDNLAEQYIDPQQLEYMTPAEKSKAIRLLSMQLSKMLPKKLKEVSVANATNIQRNEELFAKISVELGTEEAVRLANEGKAGFTAPVAAYTAYPSPHELVGSLNSSKLREFASGVIKRGMTSAGRWTDDPEQADTLSTLIGYGTKNIAYSRFEDQNDEYQRATVKRAALTELPKQLGKVFGISDADVNRQSWGGGISLNYDHIETSLDEQLESQDKFNTPQLDRYARDELARTVDVYFQPAGDLSADYVDNNLTQIDEYRELQDADASLMDADGPTSATGDDTGGGDTNVAGEGEGRAYVEPSGLEQITQEGPEVDDSFARAAPSVDMAAAEGVREGAATNQRASNGDNLGTSHATTQATHGSRLGQSLSAREARVERLAGARSIYQSQNPNISISNAPQGSQEWLDKRKLLATAADAKRMVTSDRARNTFVGEKSMENWGLTTTQPYPSEDIERGKRMESSIRREYERQTNTEVLELGLLENKGFPGGASLDGLVTQDGKPMRKGVEFKAPREFRDFAQYHDQVQMQMAVGNLDSVDIMQGVEVDGKLRTQMQTVHADMEWRKRNQGKIQQAQDSIERNAGMTQAEFLAANAAMAADKSGKYGFLVSASRIEVEEALDGKKLQDAQQREGMAFARTWNQAQKENARRDKAGGGGGGDGGDDDSDTGASGKKGKGWLATAYETVKDVTQMVDKKSQELAGAFRTDIGQALDYGVNPGTFLGNNIALRGAGMSDRDARAATLSGAQLAGQMGLGDYSGAVSQVTGTLGLLDISEMQELADNPTEKIRRITERSKARGDDSFTTAEALRRSGLSGSGTMANLSQQQQRQIVSQAGNRSTADMGTYASSNALVNFGAEAVHMRSAAAAAANFGISNEGEGWAQKQLDAIKNPVGVIGKSLDETLGELAGADNFQRGDKGETYSGQVDRSGAKDVNIHVTVDASGVSVTTQSGDKVQKTQSAYSHETTD